MIRGFMRWFFRHLYTNWAWGYDLVAWIVSLGRWWTWARSAAAPLPTGRLLEVGFGTGHLLSNPRDADLLIGIDRSRQMARFAQRRVRGRGSNSLIVRGDAQALPFADRSFDGAYSTFPAEYAFDESAMRSMYRVLQPGSEYVIVVMALIKGRSLLDRALRWLFSITGQAGPLEPSAWEARIPRVGFDIRVEILELGNSEVVRVRAKVPARSDRKVHPT